MIHYYCCRICSFPLDGENRTFEESVVPWSSAIHDKSLNLNSSGYRIRYTSTEVHKTRIFISIHLIRYFRDAVEVVARCGVVGSLAKCSPTVWVDDVEKINNFFWLLSLPGQPYYMIDSILTPPK